jgi:hypothetical protein
MKPSQDTGTVAAHYGKLLGLEEPRQVKAPQFDLLRRRVKIEVEWSKGAAVACPECGRSQGCDSITRRSGNGGTLM